jgi:hypothetical protein
MVNVILASMVKHGGGRAGAGCRRGGARGARVPRGVLDVEPTGDQRPGPLHLPALRAVALRRRGGPAHSGVTVPAVQQARRQRRGGERDAAVERRQEGGGADRYGGRFDSSNVERLLAEMSAEERARFHFEVRRVFWMDYVTNVHIPGLRKHVLKGRGSPPSARM